MTVASLDSNRALNSNGINGQVLENLLTDKIKYYFETKCPVCKQDTTMVFHTHQYDEGEYVFDLYTCRNCKDTFAYHLSDKWLAEHKAVA